MNPGSESTPKLSVITVVFNNVKHIERTILSVVNQSFRDIEYIIIDGGSTDGTLHVIEKYRSQVSTIISEKDDGIYDAMNKGLSRASGEYVLFMNSGDEIYAPDTVEQVFNSSPDADIYYGETEMIDENCNSLGQRRHQAPAILKFSSFRFGMNVSHQAIYVRRSLVEEYDLRYQLSADIDWILKAMKRAKTIVNINRYVARYMVGGMSKKRHRQSLIERFHIFSNHYGLVSNLMNHAVIAANLIFYFARHRRTND